MGLYMASLGMPRLARYMTRLGMPRLVMYLYWTRLSYASTCPIST